MSFPNPKHFFTSDPPQASRRNTAPPPASSPPLPPQIIDPQGVTLVREFSWAGLADTLPQIPESSHHFRSRVRETPLRDGEGDTHIKGTSLRGSIDSESDDGSLPNLNTLTNFFAPDNTSRHNEERGGIQFDPEKVGNAQPTQSNHTKDAWQNAFQKRPANQPAPWEIPVHPTTDNLPLLPHFSTETPKATVEKYVHCLQSSIADIIQDFGCTPDNARDILFAREISTLQNNNSILIKMMESQQTQLAENNRLLTTIRNDMTSNPGPAKRAPPPPVRPKPQRLKGTGQR